MCQVPDSELYGEQPRECSRGIFNSNDVQCVSSWHTCKTNKNFCTMPSSERSVDMLGNQMETQARAGSRRMEKHPASCLPVLATPGWHMPFKISLPGRLMQF